MISLTKSLSSELAPEGILVNCVAPGWVSTDMSAAALGHPQIGAKIAAGIPVGRPASTREIAGPILFLCTPLAGFISGEVLNVNGGAVDCHIFMAMRPVESRAHFCEIAPDDRRASDSWKLYIDCPSEIKFGQ